MLPLLRSRRLAWIALIAWTAQLFLPAAHAAVMAQQEAGLATWCGAFSPAMTQKLAALAPEVRQILEKGSTQSAQQHDCVQACSNATPAGPAPASPVLALREAGLESPRTIAAPSPTTARSLSPPVRGPPQAS